MSEKRGKREREREMKKRNVICIILLVVAPIDGQQLRRLGTGQETERNYELNRQLG